FSSYCQKVLVALYENATPLTRRGPIAHCSRSAHPIGTDAFDTSPTAARDSVCSKRNLLSICPRHSRRCPRISDEPYTAATLLAPWVVTGLARTYSCWEAR